MIGLSTDSGLRNHQLRRVRSPWVWLVVAAVSAYGVLVAIMVLNAGAAASEFRALAGTPTAARETMPAEPAARRPSSTAPRPGRTVSPEPAAGVVYYPPGSSAAPTAATAPTTPPTAAPATVPAEVVAARQAVDRARRALLALRAGGTATAAEIQAAGYELARARQNLADLEAGTPGKRHHDLDVTEARVYRDLAVERCRAVMIDPTASGPDQERAYALVRLWQKRLDDLTT